MLMEFQKYCNRVNEKIPSLQKWTKMWSESAFNSRCNVNAKLTLFFLNTHFPFGLRESDYIE